MSHKRRRSALISKEERLNQARCLNCNARHVDRGVPTCTANGFPCKQIKDCPMPALLEISIKRIRRCQACSMELEMSVCGPLCPEQGLPCNRIDTCTMAPNLNNT